MKKLAVFIATSFGTGFSPFAPGTVGALLAVIFYYFLIPAEPVTLALIIGAISIIGIWAATETEKQYGHDASAINIDEVVGMLITLFALEKTFFNIIAGFILFRFFDIVKPWLINRAQLLPRGWGVMLDDVAAGIFSCLILHAIHFFL
jgi:phosphatidylglycerophosphatase A